MTVELDKVPANHYPDLVTCLHVQIRLTGNFGFSVCERWTRGNFGFSACERWTIRADESVCFVCKEAKDDFIIFFLIARIIERVLIHFGQI